MVALAEVLDGTDSDWFVGATTRQSGVGQAGPGFTGYVADNESGLAYARNRMYSPGLGRFISRDPMDYADAYGLYMAAFVPNDIDPLGWHKVLRRGHVPLKGLKVWDLDLSGTVFWTLVCCDNEHSLVANRGKNRLIVTAPAISATYKKEGDLMNEIAKSPNAKMALKVFGLLGLKPTLPTELTGTGTISGHYDGCMETGKASGEVSITGKVGGGISYEHPLRPRDLYAHLTGGVTGSAKLSAFYKDKAIWMKPSGAFEASYKWDYHADIRLTNELFGGNWSVDVPTMSDSGGDSIRFPWDNAAPFQVLRLAQ